MDNRSTTKRMIGAVVLVLIAALLLAWLLKGKNKTVHEQELIAEQTQGASPILGFPKAEEGDQQMGDDGMAQSAGDGQYVIGSAAEQAQDGASAAAQTAGAAAGGAIDSVGSAVSGAVDSGKEAVDNLANKMNKNDTTGFEVRDSQGGEQRQVVEGGEAKPGVGSMGGSEVATGSADNAQQQAAADGAGNANQAQQAQQQAAADQGAARQEPAARQKAANPKLVNETPVPEPRAQARKQAAAADATPAATGQTGQAQAGNTAAVGGKGYAVQVLAASNKGFAEQVRQPIAADGYPTFVVKANVDGKTVYRVRVGTYSDKGGAQAAQNEMKRRYSRNQYIQNSFVTKN